MTDSFYAIVDQFRSSMDLRVHYFTKWKAYEIDTNDGIGVYFAVDDNDKMVVLVESEFKRYFLDQSEYRNIKIDNIIINEH